MQPFEPTAVKAVRNERLVELSASPPLSPQSTPGPVSEASPNASGTAQPQKRKARAQKVCQPCRARKVKCTYELPCKTCVERGHPELCEYLPDPPSKRSCTLRNVDGRDRFTPSQEEWTDMGVRLAGVEMLLRELRDAVRGIQLQLAQATAAPRAVPHPSPVPDATATDSEGRSEARSDGPSQEQPVITGISAPTDLSGESVYLGSNSVPAMVVALVEDTGPDKAKEVEELLGKSILPVFGLDNESATYPFVDLWGIPHGSFKRIELLCKLLPTADVDCMKTFHQYRDTAHVIFPGVVDVAQFESELVDFLQHRSRQRLLTRPGSLDSQSVFGQDLHWLGLLFATLASGIQCSDLPSKERNMRSQVYVCCAYECLRIINYLSRSTLVDLQTLLVIGNVISNNMNAGVAWALLGLTIRLAQSLGLHYEVASADPCAIQTDKSNIWWQIIWQDSLLSITFDRTSQASIAPHLGPSKPPSKLSYISSMRRLCKIGLDIVQRRTLIKPSENQLLEMVKLREQISEDQKHLQPHLTGFAYCRSTREQFEFWNLYLHRSYILSELCRPTLQLHKFPKHEEGVASTLHALCIESLANTVDAFLGLQSITSFATQSWAAVHRALSCALLLGILGEISRSDRVRNLIGRLTTVMWSVASGIEPNELPSPLARSMAALVKLGSKAPLLSKEKYGATFASSDWKEPHDILSQISASGTMDAPSGSSPYSVLNTIMWGALENPPSR